MNSRLVVVVSLFVALLLVGFVAYPAALTYPYSQSPSSYSVAHESTEAFEETVGQDDVTPGEPLEVSSLDPSTQQALEEAKMQPRDDGSRGEGWQHLGSVLVCDDRLLVCDEYEERPAFPDNVEAYEMYGLVEDDDGTVYLTHYDSGVWFDLSPLLEFAVKLFSFVPYAAFLAYTSVVRDRVRSTEMMAFAGYGLALALLAFLLPYLLMFDLFPTSEYIIGAIVPVTWIVIGVGLLVLGSRSASQDTQDGADH
ncbi:hypothetical protein G6M89_09805 [Natronolimnobius sp. AArcel1]|uniref:hypothetical protein n=1 Tax=Natronolimnobius sp. AArcel1 TaxID=1679093 RepID=UPI0013EDF96F|nr:hypothetical protein [Natronolimnobius sp. AArcel1]NGM69297.1 hypothetical protein [Natronolimnobius sp. AArcel1]